MFRRDKRPMWLVHRPLFDPTAKQVPLPDCQFLAAVSGRHLVGRVCRHNPADEFTVADLRRNDCCFARGQCGLRWFGFVEPQSHLPGPFIGAMTLKAVIGQNWPDVAIELDWTVIGGNV